MGKQDRFKRLVRLPISDEKFYFLRKNGKSALAMCPQGQTFNKERGICENFDHCWNKFDGFKYTTNGTSNVEYLQCENGKSVLRKCKDSLIFYDILLDCTDFDACKNKENVGKKFFHVKFAETLKDGEYLMCNSDGRVNIGQCGTMVIFNSVTNACEQDDVCRRKVDGYQYENKESENEFYKRHQGKSIKQK